MSFRVSSGLSSQAVLLGDLARERRAARRRRPAASTTGSSSSTAASGATTPSPAAGSRIRSRRDSESSRPRPRTPAPADPPPRPPPPPTASRSTSPSSAPRAMSGCAGSRSTSHEELRPIDPSRAERRSSEPLFVACTHGKHDRCCARYGRPLSTRSASSSTRCRPGSARTSAATASPATSSACLTASTTDGSTATTSRVLDEYLAGRISLAHYRGRSCWPVRRAGGGTAYPGRARA